MRQLRASTVVLLGSLLTGAALVACSVEETDSDPPTVHTTEGGGGTSTAGSGGTGTAGTGTAGTSTAGAGGTDAAGGTSAAGAAGTGTAGTGTAGTGTAGTSAAGGSAGTGSAGGPTTGTSRIRFVHVVPDLFDAAGNVIPTDICFRPCADQVCNDSAGNDAAWTATNVVGPFFDKSGATNEFYYPGVSIYTEIDEGTWELRLVNAASADCSAANKVASASDQVLTAGANNSYSVLLEGENSKAIKFSAHIEHAPPAAGKVGLTAYNSMTESDPDNVNTVDFGLLDSANNFTPVAGAENIVALAASGYGEVDPNASTSFAFIKDAGAATTGSLVYASPPFQIDANEWYHVFLHGTKTSETDTKKQPSTIVCRGDANNEPADNTITISKSCVYGTGQLAADARGGSRRASPLLSLRGSPGAMASTRSDLVLVLDFGSQYTQLIARRIRESRVYCEIASGLLPLDEIKKRGAKAIVLSGGPASVYAAGAPRVDAGVFELGVPILGICYGVQLQAFLGGGRVAAADAREYGAAEVTVEEPVGVFSPFKQGETLQVWMSHGDRIEAMPPGFRVIGSSGNTPFCAVANTEKKIYGIQFHPEVAHTPRGGEIVKAFLFEVAGLSPTWTPAAFAEEAVALVREKVGSSGNVVCGLSGGVDSSVAAFLVHKAIGDRLHCIFVDNGLLRLNEADEVIRLFKGRFDMKVHHVDARQRFLGALAGVTDPEQKRKIIGRVFIEVFEEEAKRVDDARHLVQGTLYPDVIESVSFKGPSAVIKSHHNVGGLPERMKLGLVEPLRELFKDEVRELGAQLGLPNDILWRQPFPGPGLAVRCLGDLTEARLEVLRKADAIVQEEVKSAGLYASLWQAFAVLLPIRSVGVMGDERTYDECVAVRAVHSSDGMTADWARLPHDLLATISTRITNEVRGVNRVVYDISSKPPGTIEWE
jgi:GMP synthase (glutamine-hydrolysing)